MIAIIDYGMGNLRSVQKALEAVGAQTVVTDNPEEILKADKVVLPGVGAMKPAIDRLTERKLIAPIKEVIAQKKPFLGICLGYQLLFESSDEGGQVNGLGVLKGNVTRFQQLKVPHMGWNQLSVVPSSKLLKSLEPKTEVYFCHSYFVKPANAKIIASTTNYGVDFASSIEEGNIFGVQFHPEKSQTIGLTILKNFSDL